MGRPALHRWDLTPKEAVALQAELAQRVVIHPDDRPPTRPAGSEWLDDGLPRYLGGVDASYGRFDKTGYAAVIAWDRADRRIVAEATTVAAAEFPYVPGLLGFREGPVVLDTMAALQSRLPAGVVIGTWIFDGQGIAHPRRLGLACHLGLWLDAPTIGIAKSRLTGDEGRLRVARGMTADLTDSKTGERIGAVLRTKHRTNPVYVSPGHLASHRYAIDLALACDAGYRIPEPTRLADHLTKQVRRSHSG